MTPPSTDKGTRGRLTTPPIGGSPESCQHVLGCNFPIIIRNAADSLLFPTISGNGVFEGCNCGIIDEDVYLRTVTNKCVRECRNRRKSGEVDERELSVLVTRGLYGLTRLRKQRDPCLPNAHLPWTAARPFSWLRHPRTNRLGFIEAKCFAASKPNPILAPMMTTVLPVRSACSTGSTFQRWSRMNPR